MTPLRRFAGRAPPLLHAALVGGYAAIVLALAQLALSYVPDVVVLVGASLLVAVGSRALGVAINQSFGGRDRNVVQGQVDLAQMEAALSGLIHEFVNDLSVMQAEVQFMIQKLDRLKLVLLKITRDRDA